MASNRDAGRWGFGVTFCAMVINDSLLINIYGPFGLFSLNKYNSF